MPADVTTDSASEVSVQTTPDAAPRPPLPTVRAFPAHLVHQRWAETVVCPMHDALSPTRRAQILAENPMSYLQVTRSSLDLPDAGVDEIGAANAAGLQHLLDEGAYSQLQPPAMYVYRVHLGTEEHTGLVADVDAAAFVDGRVLGHEAVHQEKVDALVRHFESVPMRSELVTLIHRSDDDVEAIVAATTRREPVLSFVDTTGVEQILWRVADDDVPVVMDHLQDRRLYIADGHHRVAATVQRWRDHGSPRGGEVLCVIYAESQVHLLAFHRVVRPTGGPVDVEAVLAALREHVAVEAVDGPVREVGVVGLRAGGSWYALTLPEPDAATQASATAQLDVSRLDAAILAPALGLRSGDDEVGYLSELADLDDVVADVDAEGSLLFLLCAPTLDQLVEVAERGEVMPQKSTYIEPKPRAGVVLRPRLGPVHPEDLPTP